MILASSHAGYPLSTTQVVSGAVTGSGVGRPGAVVNWAVAGRIVIGWLLTLPVAALTGGRRLRDHRDLRRGQRRRPDRRQRDPRICCFLLWQANRRHEVKPEETISASPVFGADAGSATPPAPVAV